MNGLAWPLRFETRRMRRLKELVKNLLVTQPTSPSMDYFRRLVDALHILKREEQIDLPFSLSIHPLVNL
jgi:hypothetical protein